MEKPGALPSPEIGREPLSRSPSSRQLKVRNDSLQEQHDVAKLQLAEERKTVLLLEERNRGVKEELAHLTSLIQTKVLKNDEERRDFASYAQERARMRDEIDVLRAQLRGETAKNAAMRVETDEARSALADHTRNKEEKERSVLRLRAALTNMEQRSTSKSNLFDFDNDLAQVRAKLTTKRRKYKEAKEKIAKFERDVKNSSLKTSERDIRLESLERELKIAKTEVDDLQQKIRGEVANHAALTHDNVIAIAELEKLQKTNKDLKSNVDELNRQLAVVRLEQDLQGPLHMLESELSRQLDEMRALQSEELSLGENAEPTSLHTSERAIHLQLEIDKLNGELEETQELTKQTESLQSKLKEAKKKNKSMKEDFTERRKVLELTKEKSESHLLYQQKPAEEPKQHRTSSGPLLLPDDYKPDNIEQLKETQKVIESSLKAIPKPVREKSNLEQHIEQLLGAVDINIPVVKKIEQARAAEKAAAEAAAREREEERRGGKETNSIEEGAGKKDMRRSDEVKRSPSVPRHVGVERAMSASNLRLVRTSSYNSIIEIFDDYKDKDVPSDWKSREKALNAQFERLKQVVIDEEKSKSLTAMPETVINGRPPAREIPVIITSPPNGEKPQLPQDDEILIRPSKVKSVEKLQKRIATRQEQMKQMGVTEMGLLSALSDEETKLTEYDEEMILEIPFTQEEDDSVIDKLMKTLVSTYLKMQEANRHRILTEVSQLIKDINSNLSHKLTRKEVDTDLEENIHVVNECKKLNFRVVTELENLQIIAQDAAKGKLVKSGWWKGWGSGDENVSDVDSAAKFLIRESQRLYDLRDNYIAVCNKVASLSESVHLCEKDIFKWRLGLEDVDDRLTARIESGSYGPALSEKFLTCRRVLTSHTSLRSSLEAARTQRATMRLLVENFSEGLYVVFSAEAGLEALGSKVVAELTKIRQAERKVMTYRGELQAEEAPTREVVPRRRVAHIAHGGLAGVSLVSSMILHYHSLFTRYSEHDVPEIIRKSIHYLLERAMDDQGLLLRTYDLPKIAQIKKFFDSGNYDVDISDCTDHRVIAELLKSHLREMKDPLFTVDLYRDWMKIDQIESDDDRLTCIRGLIEKLPSQNHSCLAVIMHFLHKVACNVTVNKCSTRLLARVFAPLMLRKR